jgi:hypothetical protein
LVGLNNPEFSREVHDIFYDVNDVAEHSLQQLYNSLWFDDWVDTEWLFDKLRKNRSILDLIGNKGMCAAKTVCNKLQKLLHQDGDEGFLQNPSVGVLVERPEEEACMVILVTGCWHNLKGKLAPPARIENTIFLWVIEREDPCCTAYKGGHVCEHYVTLNLLEPTNDLVHPDTFTFARKPPPSEKDLSEEEPSEEESSEKEPSEKESSEKEKEPSEEEPSEKESSEKEYSEKEKEPSEKEPSEKEPSEKESSEKDDYSEKEKKPLEKDSLEKD